MAHLRDLYKTQNQIAISDGVNTVPVVVRKISPLQKEKAQRRANAAQAIRKRAKNDRDSEDYLSQLNQVQEVFGEAREQLLIVVVDEAMALESQQIQARIMYDEDSEWAKDDYLQSLLDSWDNGMGQRFTDDPDDIDAAKVYAEIERFTTQVEAEVEEARGRMEDEWDLSGTPKLQEKVAEILLDRQALTLWHKEFIAARTYYSVRKVSDWRELYFDSIDEVLELDERTLQELVDAYDEISVDPIEGKDSPPAQSSSPQPELDEKAATGPSGPETADV